MPSDPKAFVEAVKAGRLPPVAPWPRIREKVEAPPFGAMPPLDVGNPVPPGKEGWNTPLDGGTLIVQYNSGPKTLNGIIDNDAVITYVNELTDAFLSYQNSVTFAYGKPSAEDPAHVFESVDDRDCAARWVKEDTLVRKEGPPLYGVVSGDGDSWVVKPLAVVEGEDRKPQRVPRAAGDQVQHGTFVTVFLKPGVRWNDGAPFTAKDVEFAYRVILSEFVNSDNTKPSFEKVKSCAALSDGVVRWVVEPAYFLADDSTLGANLHLVPLHAYRAAFEKANPGVPFDPSGKEFGQFFNNCTELNEKPLGTGPYMVEKFVAEQSVTLVRNPQFKGKERRGHADRILWKFISDEVPTLQALKSGELDFTAHGLSAEQFGNDLQAPDFQKQFVACRWYTPSISFIAYNRRVPQLADARVRAALGMLLDRPGFRERKQYGCSVLVSGDQFVSGPAYDPEVKPLAFDPAAAAALLDEAGWRDRDGDGIRDKDGKQLAVNFFITTGNKPLEELAALWLEQLKRVGVKMEVSRAEWAAFVKRFEDKKFDVITLAWASDPESDPHQLWHSKWADPSKPSSNAGSFADPRADALIEAIQTCLDPRERTLYQHALHRILDADQPYTLLWCRSEISAYDRRWRGVRLYPRRPGFDLTEWYMPAELRKDR
jgi:peptide/nickel transport system substrate-binding protein